MSRFEAVVVLAKRYGLAWKSAWAHRKENIPLRRTADELQFLPATLELQDRPPHPAAHWVAGFLLTFAGIAFLWSCFGEIEVVASANGNIIASGMSKTLQASEVSIVKAILVQEGQVVKKGQLLIELEAVNSQADVNRLQGELLSAQSDHARATVLLKAIDDKKEPQAIEKYLPDASFEQISAAGIWAQGQYVELMSKVGQIDAEIDQLRTQIATARKSIASASKILSLSTRIAESSKELAEGDYIPRNLYFERERVRIDHAREIESQQRKLVEVEASIKVAQQRRNNVTDQLRIAMLDLQGQSIKTIKILVQELQKAEYRNHLMSLVSPVDGAVQELAVHTVGGVVTAAQSLMVIVPHDLPTEADVLLDNKDVGFVYPGQAVAVKVDSYSYVKYGIFDGEVLSISRDSIPSDLSPPKYNIRIRINSFPPGKSSNNLVLSPGMTVTAELKIYKRTVLDYFAEPLWRSLREGLRER